MPYVPPAAVYVIFVASILGVMYSSNYLTDSLGRSADRAEMAQDLENSINNGIAIDGQMRSADASLENCTITITKVYDRIFHGNISSQNIVRSTTIIQLSELTNANNFRIYENTYRPGTAFIDWQLNKLAGGKEMRIYSHIENSEKKYQRPGFYNNEHAKKFSESVGSLYDEIRLESRAYIELCGAQKVISSPALRNGDAYRLDAIDKIVDLVLAYKGRFC